MECSLRTLRLLCDEEQWEKFQECYGPYEYEQNPGMYVKLDNFQLEKIGLIDLPETFDELC